MAARIFLPVAIAMAHAVSVAGQASTTSGNPLNAFISQAAGAASAISAANTAGPTTTSASSTSATSTHATPSATSSAAAAASGSSGLAQGAIIAIAVVCVVVVLLLLALILGCLCLRRRRARRHGAATTHDSVSGGRAHRRGCCGLCGGRRGRGRSRRVDTPDSDVVDRNGWKRNSPPHGGLVDHPHAMADGPYPPMRDSNSMTEKDFEGHHHGGLGAAAGAGLGAGAAGSAMHHHHHDREKGLQGGHHNHSGMEAAGGTALGAGALGAAAHHHNDHHEGFNDQHHHHPGMGAAAGTALGAGAAGAAMHHYNHTHDNQPLDHHHPGTGATGNTALGAGALGTGTRDHNLTRDNEPHNHHHPGMGAAAGAALGAGALGVAAHEHNRHPEKPHDSEHPAFRHERAGGSPSNINAANPFTPKPPVARKPIPSPAAAPANNIFDPARGTASHHDPTTAPASHPHAGLGAAAAAAAGGAALGAGAMRYHDHGKQQQPAAPRSRDSSRARAAYNNNCYNPQPLASHPSHPDLLDHHHPGASDTGAVVDGGEGAQGQGSRLYRPPTPMGLNAFDNPSSSAAQPSAAADPTLQTSRPSRPTVDTAAATAAAGGAAGAALAHRRSHEPHSTDRAPPAFPDDQAAAAAAAVDPPPASLRHSLQAHESGAASRPAAQRYSWAERDDGLTSPTARGAPPRTSPRRLSRASPVYESTASPASTAGGGGYGGERAPSPPPQQPLRTAYGRPATGPSPHDSAYVSNTDASSTDSWQSARMSPPLPQPQNPQQQQQQQQPSGAIGGRDYYGAQERPLASGALGPAAPAQRATVPAGWEAPWEQQERARRWSGGSASGSGSGTGVGSGGYGSGGEERSFTRSPRKSLGADGKPRRLRFSDVGPEEWRYDERGPVGQAL